MRYTIIVKPNSKSEGIEEDAAGRIVVRTREPAKEGKANEAVRRMLAKHFCVAPSRVVILRGARSKIKMVEILP